MSLRQLIFTLFALYFACGSLPSVSSGVYPNYRPHFDFTAWDKEQNLTALDEAQKWWEAATFYQIYPRSFKDSNGDGIGDLNGITEQLYYLQEIGVAATWLSPIFTSPMADFGYDIANYTEIASIFGTMADFEVLIAKATELGLKIILDFVPNHTSDESEWFIKSAAKDPEYTDFYVWHPGKMVNDTRQPPTNWVSVFHGPAWAWHDGRQEYYLHEFLTKQPDLNYRNPKVCEAMKDVLRFWLSKGVSGFRVDAVPFLFEIAADAEGNWPDEPRNEDVKDPTDYGYLKHIYTVDQPETLDMVYQWRAVLYEFQKEHGGDERVMLTEAYSPIDVMMKYYGNETVNGAQIPFNFLLINWIGNDSDAYHYADTVNTWLNNMPQGRTPNWVIGNHDQNRVGSRLGADRIDMINMLIFTLPGVGITYNGEEIGMTDVWISWNDTVDPSACNTNPDIYEKFSRDPERTPFQWNDGDNAGFSNATKTWLPIASNYKDVNVKSERSLTRSHLNIYKELQELRKVHTMRHGDVDVKALSPAVLSVKRTLLDDHTYLMLMNIHDDAQVLNLKKFYENIPAELEYVIVTPQSNAKLDDHVKTQEIHLAPKEAIVLRSLTKLTTTAGYYTYYTPDH